MRNFHVDAWKTRGHMRTYKSGKTVYIKETTHHRKAHNGDAQNVKLFSSDQINDERSTETYKI